MNQVKIEKMELLTSADINILCSIMEKHSGLRREQYAINSWGFPFIPIPEPRTISEKTRLAPLNVEHQFLGHPIYWIDPELTHFDREKEPEEQWCIRMYYVILAFGLWWEKDDSKWIDFLDKSGYVYERADVEHYLSKQHLESLLDGYSFLTEKDMRLPWVDMKEQYELIMAECESRLIATVSDFFNRQEKSLLVASDVFGTANLESVDTTAVTPGGFWTNHVVPLVEEIEREYQHSFLEGEDLSPYAGRLEDLGAKISRIIILMEEAIAILSIPVLRTAAKNSQDWSEMMTFLRIGQYQAIQLHDGRYGYRDLITDKVVEDTNAMSKNRENIPSVSDIYSEWESDYSSAWRRFRLVVANYQRMQHNQKPFTRESSLMHHLRTHKTTDEMSIETAAVDSGDKEYNIEENKIVDTIEKETQEKPAPVNGDIIIEEDYSEIDNNLKEVGLYHGDLSDVDNYDDEDEDIDLNQYTRGRRF